MSDLKPLMFEERLQHLEATASGYPEMVAELCAAVRRAWNRSQELEDVLRRFLLVDAGRLPEGDDWTDVVRDAEQLIGEV